VYQERLRTPLADVLAQDARFTFVSVDDVRRVLITTSPVIGTNYLQITVSGAGYA
jgi:hypothetical protein